MTDPAVARGPRQSTEERFAPRCVPSVLARQRRAVRASVRWDTYLPRPPTQECQAVLITGFPSDATATNCWVVAPAPGEQCVVIDPGIGVAGRLDEVIAEHRLHPVAVLLTHG